MLIYTITMVNVTAELMILAAKELCIYNLDWVDSIKSAKSLVFGFIGAAVANVSY